MPIHPHLKVTPRSRFSLTDFMVMPPKVYTPVWKSVTEGETPMTANPSSMSPEADRPSPIHARLLIDSAKVMLSPLTHERIHIYVQIHACTY